MTPSTIRSCEAAPMPGKTGSDLEELRALLAEVKALREDVERKGAELRRGWGVDADKSKVTPRALNLSQYIALREHDLTDLQYRLAARGLSSLGRSESHVAQALDTLIATLKRLSGESGAAYPSPTVGEGGRGGAGGGGRSAVRQAAKRRPSRAGDGDLAARGGDGTRIGRQSGDRWHGLRAHQLRPRRSRNVGANGRARARRRPRGSSVPAGC